MIQGDERDRSCKAGGLTSPGADGLCQTGHTEGWLVYLLSRIDDKMK